MNDPLIKNKALRAILDVDKETAAQLLDKYENKKGLCCECSMYRPLKKVNGHNVCKLCEVYYI